MNYEEPCSIVQGPPFGEVCIMVQRGGSPLIRWPVEMGAERVECCGY